MFSVAITVQKTLHRASAELRLGEGQLVDALWSGRSPESTLEADT